MFRPVNAEVQAPVDDSAISDYDRLHLRRGPGNDEWVRFRSDASHRPHVAPIGDTMIARLATGLCLGATLLASSIAHAEEAALTPAEIRQFIVGRTVYWPGGDQSTYGADGSYRWSTYGRSSEGTYSIVRNATCVRFKTGGSRCDDWYRDGSTFFMKRTSPNGTSRMPWTKFIARFQ